MEKLKAGVIGIGDISDVYLKNLLKYRDVIELWGCASRGIQKARKKAEQYGIPRCYASGDELIADPEIDIVLNLTTPKVHYHYNKKALEAGKHVYSEKPLAATFAEGKELLALAEQNGKCIGCAPDTFMGGRLQTYRELVAGGKLGEIFGATVTAVSRGAEWFHPNPAFFYQPGAGPLYDIGPYYITALLSLLGPVKKICAMKKTAENERVIERGPLRGQKIEVHPDVDTHVIANLEFVCGAVATVIMSFDVWDSELPRMEIYGTKGTLCMKEPDPCDGPNLFGGDVLMRDRENYRWIGMPREQGAVETEWKKMPVRHGHNSTSHEENSRGIGLVDMVYAINEKREPRAGGAMALHTLEVMEGVIRSAKEGRYISMTTTFAIPDILSADI